jgi:peptidoglycan/LPS O-acetylase OafA/YrhL
VVAYYGSLSAASPGWTILVEVGRALVWTAIALPVIRMMKGQWWEAGVAVALLFGVLLVSWRFRKSNMEAFSPRMPL